MSEWSPASVDILRAVIDRIIPGDEDPSATDLGVDRYILRQMRAGAVPDQDRIRAGLDALSTTLHEGRGRTEPEPVGAELDAALQGVATTPWFKVLIELAAEGYYADPGNGGNSGARSWAMIGYEHRLPDGPDGPPSGIGDAPGVIDGPVPAETAEHRNGG